jgi:hypothetical protein
VHILQGTTCINEIYFTPLLFPLATKRRLVLGRKRVYHLIGNFSQEISCLLGVKMIKYFIAHKEKK